MLTLSKCKHAFAAPLREILRKQMRHRIGFDSPLLPEIEGWLRGAPGATDPIFVPGVSPLLQSLLWKLDRETYRRLFQRLHRVATKGAPRPLLRSYRYKGFEVTHDIRHTAQWNAYITGRHQQGVGHWLARYAASSTVALDIGANVGIFSLEMADAMHGEGIVHAFEPNPDAYTMLERIVRDNDLEDRVRVHRFAVGDKDATVPLHIPDGNAGAASLEPSHRSGRTLEVQVRGLAGWWQDAGRPDIGLIKVDVEGHEAEVLRALLPLLNTIRPVIVMEVTPAKADHRNIIASLSGCGYTVRRILSHEPWAEQLPHHPPRQMDVLCEPV